MFHRVSLLTFSGPRRLGASNAQLNAIHHDKPFDPVEISENDTRGCTIRRVEYDPAHRGLSLNIEYVCDE